MTKNVTFQKGIEISREELPLNREAMFLTPTQARLKLKEVGLLTQVINYIAALPNDNELKILWEYSTSFDRLNPVLVSFCTNVLSLTEEQIDSLFL